MAARSCRHARAARDHRQIGGIQVLRRDARVAAGPLRLAHRAIVDDRADRHAVQQLGDTADMIGMIMADDQRIDLREPQRPHFPDDALHAGRHRRRAGRHAGAPARIDQQRPALGCDEQGAPRHPPCRTG